LIVIDSGAKYVQNMKAKSTIAAATISQDRPVAGSRWEESGNGSHAGGGRYNTNEAYRSGEAPHRARGRQLGSPCDPATIRMKRWRARKNSDQRSK